MKDKFVVANIKHMPYVYKMWNQFAGLRLFGLEKSINEKSVYVYLYRNKVCGFVRFEMHNKTLDYLRFNEVCCIKYNVVTLRTFFKEVDMLTFKFGYIKAKVSTSRTSRDFLMIGGWKIEDSKFIISSKQITYNKYVLVRHIDIVNKNYFGRFLLIKQKVL